MQDDNRKINKIGECIKFERVDRDKINFVIYVSILENLQKCKINVNKIFFIFINVNVARITSTAHSQIIKHDCTYGKLD